MKHILVSCFSSIKTLQQYNIARQRLVYPFCLIGGHNLAKLKQNFKDKTFQQIFLRKYLLLLVHLFFLLLLHKCYIISYLLLIYQNERYAMFTLYIYICIYIYKQTYLYIHTYIYIYIHICIIVLAMLCLHCFVVILLNDPNAHLITQI